MSDFNEEFSATPPEITEQANVAINNLLPPKSKDKYEYNYEKFISWRRKKNVTSFSENVLLVYFENLAKTLKPSSLWAIYSMLRSTLNIKNNVDISKYLKLRAYLKRVSDGYKGKKSSTFTTEQINQFIKEAPDEKYLFSKVALVIAVSGACRKKELKDMQVHHVKDMGHELYIKIPDTKNKTERSFIVSGNFYDICKKYMSLRPTNADSSQFFLNYQNGKCTRQVVGINKLGDQPKTIAKFLHLDNPEKYTGHCFRRSSATILVDGGGDLMALKRHGGWKSQTVAEGYVDNSMAAKRNTSNVLLNSIENICIPTVAVSQNNDIRPSTSNCDGAITLNNCNNVTLHFHNYNTHKPE